MEARSEEHVGRVVALLLSGDVQARMVFGERPSVQVSRGNESIVWSNVVDVWAWTAVDLTTGEVDVERSL